jgi:hypothetical protein
MWWNIKWNKSLTYYFKKYQNFYKNELYKKERFVKF